MRHSGLALASLAFAFTIGIDSLGATTLGPTDPARGGNTEVVVGDWRSGSGQTRTYDNFDFTDFDQLWWGPVVGAAMDGAIDSAGEQLSFSHISGSTAYWLGSTTVDTDTGEHDVTLTFSAEIMSGGAGWIESSGIGVGSGDAEVVSEVTSGPFEVHLLLTATVTDIFLGTLAHGAFFDAFDALSGTGDSVTRSSLDRQFFYTDPLPSPVPLPAALPLFLAGLAGLGYMGWRKSPDQI